MIDLMDKDNQLPTRRMKKIFKWWWASLSTEEQVRIRENVCSAYAQSKGIKVSEIKVEIEKIKQRHKDTTAMAKKGKI